MKVLCENCGAELEQYRASQRFCSNSCGQAWWNQHRWRGPHEHTCVVCGTQFTGKRSSRKFCSDKCKELARKQKRDTIKVCSICQKKFHTTDHRRKRCFECEKYRSKGIQRVSPEMRAVVLRGQNGTCWVCKGHLKFNQTKVHHLDGSGHSQCPNNSQGNLVAVHGTCHRLFHQVFLVRKRETWYVSGGIFRMIQLKTVPVDGA